MKKTELNRNQIKYIAIIAMIIDHIAIAFVSPGGTEAPLTRIALYSAMRVIGRLTAPIMLFFLVEGFIHTSSRKKYGTRLFIFGLISQAPYALMRYNTLLKPEFNVMITLFLAFLMLLAADSISSPWLKWPAVAGIILVTFCCDWGLVGPLMALLFYLNRSSRKAQMISLAAVCALQLMYSAFFLVRNGYHWYGELWHTGILLVIPVLLCYNGKAGSRSPVNKWVFYIIYPLHLLILWFIKYHM